MLLGKLSLARQMEFIDFNVDPAAPADQGRYSRSMTKATENAGRQAGRQGGSTWGGQGLCQAAPVLLSCGGAEGGGVLAREVWEWDGL